MGVTSKPHSQTCKSRILAELAKTPEGKARIAQASERIDRTVAERGEMHRSDVPQGEKEDMVQHQTPPEFEDNVEFIPMAADQAQTDRAVQPRDDLLMREDD